jgi:hypothetical protein
MSDDMPQLVKHQNDLLKLIKTLMPMLIEQQNQQQKLSDRTDSYQIELESKFDRIESKIEALGSISSASNSSSNGSYLKNKSPIAIDKVPFDLIYEMYFKSVIFESYIGDVTKIICALIRYALLI